MLLNFIKQNNIGTLYENVSLKDKTTLRIGGIVKYFLVVKDIKALKKIIKFCYLNKIKYFIIGNGSNLLISDEYYDTLFISLKKINKYFKINKNTYLVEAGLSGIKFGKKMIENGFLDSIHLSLIPGTIGGFIYMNASAFKYSMKDITIKVIYMDRYGNLKSKSDNFEFDYRKSFFQNNNYIIVASILKFNKYSELTKEKYQKFLKIKKTTQPINEYSAGSIFKNLNDVKAWELIEKCNLRGYTVGDAMVSNMHTNFLINKKNATFNEMYSLIYFVKRKVKEQFNIELVPEIKIITKDSICPCQFKSTE